MTTELIRERVKSYLEEKETKDALKSFEKLVRLDAGQITYQKNPDTGEPIALIWTYETLVKLDEQQKDVDRKLTQILTEVFGNYKGGLLTTKEAEKVLKVTKLTPTTFPPPQPPAPPGKPTKTVVYYYVVPVYCGCPWSCCGYQTAAVLYYYQVPAVASASSATQTSLEDTQESSTSSGAAPPDVIQKTYSVVRRKLLLKNNKSPDDAGGLYQRAVQAYGYGEYREALDLLAVGVHLDSKDARYWQAKASCERALGDTLAARASARRVAALQLLSEADPRQNARLTREEATQIVAEPVPHPLATGMASTKKVPGESSQLAQKR